VSYCYRENCGKKISNEPIGIQTSDLRLEAIIAIIFIISASKPPVFKYFGLLRTFFKKLFYGRNPLLYNHRFVFNSDIDVKLFFKLLQN